MKLQNILLTVVALGVTGFALYNTYIGHSTHKRYVPEFIKFKTDFNKVHNSPEELEFRF